jgi:hypothetical protein
MIINDQRNNMKLNLGSGISGPSALNVITRDHTGWKHIDICPLYDTTECYDISQGIRELDNSVEQIWMGDFFEHLLRIKAKFVLQECFRVLQPSGNILISVPDMAVAMPLWLKSDGDEEGCANLIWGQQDHLNEKNQIPDSHFNGFTEKSLSKLLSTVGFTKINRIGIHKVWFELAVQAYK